MFSLSLRIYSPKIEMFNQIHKEDVLQIINHGSEFKCNHGYCIMYSNSTYCNVKDFVKSVKFTTYQLPYDGFQPHIFPSVDHRYPSPNNASHSLPTVILYSDIRSMHFADAHKTLSFLAQNNHINYYFRPIMGHVHSGKSNRKTFLSGYGVELAIKSTEYKAKDDDQIKENSMDQAEALSQHSQDEDGDIVQGLNFTRLKELHPEIKDNLVKFREHLLQNASELRTLKAWELNDMSFRAAQLVAKAETLEDKLKVMRDISQNFPTKAPSLLGTECSPALKKEISRNQMETFQMQLNLPEGESLFFVNRQPVDLGHFNVFELFQTLRKEIRPMKILGPYGIQGSDAQDILSTRLELKEEEIALDFTSSSIKYINDLETDDEYRGWSPSLSVMEQTFWFGMVTEIRKNLFNVIILVDPLVPNATLPYLKALRKAYTDKQPYHMGIVLDVAGHVSSDENPQPKDEKTLNDENFQLGTLLYGAYNYAYLNGKKRLEALDLLIELSEALQAANWVEDGRNLEAFEKILCSIVSSKFGLNSGDCLALRNNHKYISGSGDGREYYQNSGLESLPQILFNGVPLTKQQLDPLLLEKELSNLVMKNYYTFYEAYFNHKINDRMNVVAYLNGRSNVLPRINKDILTLSGPYLDFRQILTPQKLPVDIEALDSLPVDIFDLEETMTVPYLPNLVSQKLIYLYKKTDSALKPISIWLICDVDTRAGRLMVQNALKFLKSSMYSRVAIIHNPSVSDASGLIKASLQAALDTQPMNVVKLFLNKLLKDRPRVFEELNDVIKECSVTEMDLDKFRERAESYLDTKSANFVRLFNLHTKFSRRSLVASPGESLIVANGKGIRLSSDPTAIFSPSDYGLAEKFMYNSVSKNLATKIEEMADDLGEYKINDLVMKLSGALLWAKNDARRVDVKVKHNSLGCFSSTVPANSEPEGPIEAPVFEVMAILDPLSREAQLLSHVLLVLKEVINANVKVCFNCKAQISEMPLKNYYRYVLKPEIQFPSSTEGSAVAGHPIPASARFGNPPANSLFTMHMHTPQNWMIQSIKTPYDLDNIHMSEVASDIYATFELEYLLLEGHCYDKTSDKPPRGLQFTLGPASDPLMTDTLVMANLGYFQMKSHPGAFVLQLRSGKSADIYRVVSHQNTDSAASDSQEIIVVLDSFLSKTIHVKVTKKPGKFDQDLLSENGESPAQNEDDIMAEEDIDEEDIDFNSDKKSRVKKGKDSNIEGDGNKLDTINIFSVASGHLYERFLKLMMLSVLKHTKNPVKFWFLKNYLSPTFKEFIPHMAKEYHFDYELVQYKWPRWLHQQTEKQRIIWGYKILFLDVLFPLHLDKIIYVDADQIVRADMQELVNLDLGGAPYGYTPFCDSRSDMDGFRFWKSGYWASHLGHRKYHISALYVVDLKKFRQIAAGDRLRGQYQGLSQDPNSLSNLDQDLPNNMIHQVMIKSLPQDWLWCETWCSNESKARAKTIDLCNNPMTKEPKLHSAMRIIPEWKDYDNEIKNFTEKLKNNTNQQKPRTDQKTTPLKNDRSEL